MVPELRKAYNAAFAEERYRAMCAWLQREGGSPIDFRVSETPVFLDERLARPYSHSIVPGGFDV